MKYLIYWFCLLIILLLCSCNDLLAPSPSGIKVTNKNSSSFCIQYFYIKDHGASSWGNERLSGKLCYGDSKTIDLDPKTYDVLLKYGGYEYEFDGIVVEKNKYYEFDWTGSK